MQQPRDRKCRGPAVLGALARERLKGYEWPHEWLCRPVMLEQAAHVFQNRLTRAAEAPARRGRPVQMVGEHEHQWQ